MNLSTTDLRLAPDSTVDLQMHTIYSDGVWVPEELFDHLIGEQFGLVAITDHDRPDIAARLQQLAIAKQMPLLVAVEMTTEWQGQLTDVLCYGFDLHQQALTDIADDLTRRQSENTREVYESLVHQGYVPQGQLDELSTLLAIPSSRQPHALVELVKRHGHGSGVPSAGKIVREAGCTFVTNEIGKVVVAAHQSGALCIIAHPGREDGFICYDVPILDKLRSEVPIDGLEVYYPVHTAEQVAMFHKYAKQHGLLMSAGSDSHGPNKLPIPYRADLIPALLERMGVRVG